MATLATGQVRFEFAKILDREFVTMIHSSPRFASVKHGVYQNPRIESTRPIHSPLSTIHQQPGIEADTPSKPYISPHFRNSVNFVAFNRLRRDRVKTTIVLFRPPIFYLSARRVLA